MASENEIYEEPAYSRQVLEMIRVAHEYCLFVEKTEMHEREYVAGFFLNIGPLLYLKGSLLPDVVPENPEANERFVTEEEWEAVFNGFRNILLPLDEFWHLDYEDSVENEPVKASLSENLTDIYQDLKDFILLYQKNSRDAKQNAVAECRHLFETRWGIKIIASLRYIHFLSFGGKRAEKEDYLS